MVNRHRRNGTSLAKGPVWLIGLVLVAFGVTALIFGGHGFAQHVPTGAVHGKTWLGLEVNGWSGLLFITAGLLLLLGAPTTPRVGARPRVPSTLRVVHDYQVE